MTPDAARYEPFPLTDMQQAYWLGSTAALDLGEVANHGYEEFDCIDLDLKRFIDAWRRLVVRHDMLRAVMLPDGRQRILPESTRTDIEVLDLRGKPPIMVEERLAELRESLSHQVRPPGYWPLVGFRATLLEGGRTRLHSNIDGLVADSWSCHILHGELCELYRNPAAELEPLDYSFRDFVLDEARAKESPQHRKSMLYWRARLAGLPPAPGLPVLRRPAGRPRFKRLTRTLGAEEWLAVKHWASAERLSPTDVVMAAYAEVLAEWSEEARFTLTVPIANRTPYSPQVNRMVGEFISFVLLEVDCSADATLPDRARALRRQLWSDLDHKSAAGVALLRELALLRGRKPGPMFPVVFSSNIVPGADAKPLGGIGTSVYHITQTPQVWLDHLVTEQSGTLVIDWDALDGVFPGGMLEEMLEAELSLLLRRTRSAEAGRGVWKPSGRACPVWVPGRVRDAGPGETREIGRLLPDGSIETFGLEEMCPAVDGRRVAIQEVERVLSRHEAVRESALKVEGEGSGKRLVGYVEVRTAGRQGERVAYKLSEPGLRARREGERQIALLDGTRAESWYVERRSYRRFGSQAVNGEEFGRWLGAMRGVEVEGAPVAKYRYASGGGLYAVRVYLGIKAGAVEGLAEGGYYYQPRRHELVEVWKGELGDPVHVEINRETGRQAGMTVYLVGARGVVEAVYGEAWREFCLLEAGGMAQLLMEEGAKSGIGVCPIGRVELGEVGRRLGWGEDEELLHTMVGGAIGEEQKSGRGWVKELGEVAQKARVEEELKRHLRERVPEYMVPVRIVEVERLPRTADGAIDRDVIPRLVPEITVPVAAQTEAECAVARLCGEILGHAPSSIDDNLLDLGANSMHLVLIGQRLGVPVVDLFRYTTIRTLARSLSGVRFPESETAVHDRAALRRASRARTRPSQVVVEAPTGSI